MPRLAIYLLGSFKVYLDSTPLFVFRTDKARALLAYLAVEDGRSHRREALAAMLWPDRPTAAVRANLRQELYGLRKMLDDQASSNPYFFVSPHHIQFNFASDYFLDAAEFISLIQKSRSHHPNKQTLCAGCLEKLEAAIKLYQGDFLAGFSLADCPSFDWWQLNRQEVYHQMALDTLAWLGRYYESSHEYNRMSNFAQIKVELEPWSESAHRLRMRALVLCGQRGQALHQYEICRDILDQELGVEPAAETTQLYNQIRDGMLLRVLETVDELSERPPLAPRENDRPHITTVTAGGYESDRVELERCLPVALSSEIPLAENRISSKAAMITGVRFLKPGGTAVSEISSGEPLWIEIEYAAKKSIREAVFRLSIVTQDEQVCFESSTEAANNGPLNLSGAGKVQLKIERLELMEGQYYIDIGLFQTEMLPAYDYYRHYYPLSVLPPLKSRGILHPPHRWEYIG